VEKKVIHPFHDITKSPCAGLQAVEKAARSEPCVTTQVGYLPEEFTSVFKIRENTANFHLIHGFQQRLEEDTPPEYHTSSGFLDKLKPL